jgi:hypothetical protein
MLIYNRVLRQYPKDDVRLPLGLVQQTKKTNVLLISQ